MSTPLTIASSATTPQYIRALVYGPPGSLKTASSVTLSEHCPADWTHLRLTTPPKRETVHLADMLWLAFDAQALFGFSQLGVSAPLIDLSAVPAAQLQTKLDEALKLVKAEVDAGRTKTVVVDTVSRADGALTAMLTAGGYVSGDDSRGLYRELAHRHFGLHMRLNQLSANVLYLAHAKSAQETQSASSKPTEQATAAIAAKKKEASGTAEITAEITGKSLNLYRGDGSFVFHARRGKRMIEGKAVDGYWFFTGDQRLDGKARLILPEVLPADWRVVKRALCV